MEIERHEKLFDPDGEFGKILVKWWKGLEQQRGARAELRRAKNPTEVVFSPAYHQLYHALRLPDREALSCVAGLCSHVKDQLGGSVAEQMASGEKARVSGSRFRRLLVITDRDELYRMMIRIIRLLGGTVNICDLAQAMYWWNEKTKKQWAYAYYEHAKDEK